MRNRRISRWTIPFAATLAVVTVLLAPQTAHAGILDQNRHCVYDVIDEDANGMFVLGPPRCYPTFAGALVANGGVHVAADISPRTVSSAQLVASGFLATHYDGTGWSGSSFSISGTTCGGGGLNVPLSWNDRISSTANGCNNVVHYENTNYGGSWFTTTGLGGDIVGYMDNKTSSIKYFG